MTTRALFSIIATLAVMVFAIAYLSLGVLNIRPLADQTVVTISAPQSNGLHAGSAVVFRGVPIGDIRSVTYTGHDIEIEAAFDAGYRIPVSSEFVIANQSMLGESGLFVNPPAGEPGPVIENGQTLDATTVAVPASVPELLGSTQTLLDQVDPTVVNDLVDTLTVALRGTESDVATLEPAAQLLAASMIYSQPAMVKLIRNGTVMLADGSWIGPSMRPTKQELIITGENLRDVITHVKPFADFTNGGELIGERWKPTLTRAATLVGDLVPPISGLAQALVPAAQRSGASLATLDISALLDQTMTVLPGDSLRLNVTAPK